MKKIFLILPLLLIAVLASAQDKLNVVASTSIFADMAKEIGGDKVDVKTIVSIGSDPHTYEAVPSDAQLVKNADVILKNGLTLEGWIDKIIQNSGTQGVTKVITEGVDAIHSEIYHNAYDPHAWMVASNGMIYAQNIYSTLVKVDPENEAYYRENLDHYLEELKSLDSYIRNEVQNIPKERRIIITSHDAFAYYGRSYGFKLSAIKGVSTEAEAQTSDYLRVNKDIKESGIPAIFIESTINPKVLQQIAKDNNVKIGGELYSDSLGEPGSEADTYLKMLKHNTDVIVSALSGKEMSHTKIDDDHQGSNLWIYAALGAVMLLGLVFIIMKMNR